MKNYFFKLLCAVSLALPGCTCENFVKSPCEYIGWEVTQKVWDNGGCKWIRVRSPKGQTTTLYLTSFDYHNIEEGQIINCEPARLIPHNRAQ